MSFIHALWLYPFYVFDVDSGPDSFLVLVGFVVGCGLVWLGFRFGSYSAFAVGFVITVVSGASVIVDIINFNAALNAARDAGVEVTTW